MEVLAVREAISKIELQKNNNLNTLAESYIVSGEENEYATKNIELPEESSDVDLSELSEEEILNLKIPKDSEAALALEKSKTNKDCGCGCGEDEFKLCRAKAFLKDNWIWFVVGGALILVVTFSIKSIKKK